MDDRSVKKAAAKEHPDPVSLGNLTTLDLSRHSARELSGHAQCALIDAMMRRTLLSLAVLATTITTTRAALDAAYYVGYAGLSTFDRTLVDIRATRDQWDARLARPDNCTFTVGKNKQRGVADHVPNAPAGRVYMRHFRSLP